jgi:hypothetical protein
MAGAGMTSCATEQQDDVAMDYTLAVPAEPAGPEHGNIHVLNIETLYLNIWELQVKFNNGMWWTMPYYLSGPILELWIKGAQLVSYIWDWKDTRKGSYRPDGADTSINRYIIDFDTMYQRNSDNDRTRKVKVVCVVH